MLQSLTKLPNTYKNVCFSANQEVKMSGNLTWQGDNQAIVTVEVIDGKKNLLALYL